MIIMFTDHHCTTFPRKFQAFRGKILPPFAKIFHGAEKNSRAAADFSARGGYSLHEDLIYGLRNAPLSQDLLLHGGRLLRPGAAAL